MDLQIKVKVDSPLLSPENINTNDTRCESYDPVVYMPSLHIYY